MNAVPTDPGGSSSAAAVSTGQAKIDPAHSAPRERKSDDGTTRVLSPCRADCAMTVCRQLVTVALPYQYVTVPQDGDGANRPAFPIRYCANRTIGQTTRDALDLAGFTRVQSPTQFNVLIGFQRESDNCRHWQKVNHWPHEDLIWSKSGLHNRMMELNSRVHQYASFYPESYVLPEDGARLAQRWRENKVWIVKPCSGARGSGIHLLDSSQSDPPRSAKGIVVQVYIQRPFLIQNRRFDVRLYALVLTVTPLRIYLHEAGLARFAEKDYRDDGALDDRKIHLTNADRQKSGNWSLTDLFKHLEERGVSTNELKKEFERITISTFIAGMCKIRESLPVANRRTCFELYGLDLILDSDLKCWLLEVNVSPAMPILNSDWVRNLKFPLTLDLLRMARVIECDPTIPDPCPAAQLVADEVQRSISDDRRKRVERGELKPWDDPVFADFMIVRDFLEETDLKTGFRLIYPTVNDISAFNPCFDKYCYEDVVFHEWISMSEPEQVSALQKHWAIFESAMERIRETAARS
jgi:tubulin polyglutamylase TTLL4